MEREREKLNHLFLRRATIPENYLLHYNLDPLLYRYNHTGANEDDIEPFIVNCMNGAASLPPEKIIDLTNQLFEIT